MPSPRIQNIQWSSIFSPQYDREILSLALPALAAMLLEPVLGAISSALIGQVGTQQLGAVSIGSLCIAFSMSLFTFLLFLTTPEIAAAVAQKSPEKVSIISSKGLWLAAFCGSVMTVLLLTNAEAIVSCLKPSEPIVADYATQYIQIRSACMVPALMGNVAVATFRGHKDTRTPLYAAGMAAACGLTLNIVFLHGLGWGVPGAALATTLASVVSPSIMLLLLLRKGMLKLKDMSTPPTLLAVVPMLRSAIPLMTRTLISLGMVLFASSQCVRAGSVYQASFEVVRIVWVTSIQSFECLNVATQSLCASYLGKLDQESAQGVLLRLAGVGATAGGVAGLLMFSVQEPLTRIFTSDLNVIAQVLMTLPLVAAFLPLDAVASIMDGGLMAAKQTDYLAYIQIASAGVQYMALWWLASNNMISVLSIWACLKLLTVFRACGGVKRHFFSSQSGYLLSSPSSGEQQVA
ncbi:hypothetical protein CEUSTIGMA_g7394.t1 [Chlamydomonas eustigma]|uniref:Protein DETOXIFICATION n=1 Tax=Chlamydomonas eustigma TaxID=1157962 RepID=A0A250XA25_9CHLO|nr:hypothetical protein CEUSTIGMA_g7394.t1 [Chlamydomonas eustigma]|eukprot:GAX79955.1 hypothetical protein CEUSTIGMA_g7394.t1 [Chlamydomonas eustigma]